MLLFSSVWLFQAGLREPNDQDLVGLWGTDEIGHEAIDLVTCSGRIYIYILHQCVIV